MSTSQQLLITLALHMSARLCHMSMRLRHRDLGILVLQAGWTKGVLKLCRQYCLWRPPPAAAC